MSRRYWLPPGHATELAEHRLKDLGWTPTDASDWNLAWTLEHPEPDTFAAAQSGRWVNHIRGINALVIKSQLCVTLRDAAARARAAGAGALYRFAPQTFVLPSEWDAWQRARAWDPDAVWIQKPADLSRGRGVELVTDPETIGNRAMVVQRYISNPHLLDGFKYSLRFYVAIVSIDPLIAYVFDGGFTKFTSRPFSLDPADRADRFRHLTNPDILRDDPQAAGVSTRNTTHRTYRARLDSMGVDSSRLWREITRLLAATVGAAQPMIRTAEAAHDGTGRGQFELLGVDVTIDDQLRPWLLECNLSPSLSVEASAQTDASREEADIKTRVIADTLRLVGADTLGAPRPSPTTPGEARDALAWHEQRRGGFEPLWPSDAALESLAGMELSPLDIALLEDQLAQSDTVFAANNVESLTCGRDTVLIDRRSHRVSLLDSAESHAWNSRQGVAWLQEGWLAIRECADPLEPVVAAPAPRPRQRWNRDRVYEVRGLRIAVACASPVAAEHLGRALAWSAADDLDIIDASLFVPRHEHLADVLARIDRLALQKAGGVVRRRLMVTGTHPATLVLAGPVGQASHRHVMIGGTPFGAWTETARGLEPLALKAIVASRATPGDALLDLVSDGPGVVRSLDPESLRALAKWLEAMPILAAG